jgi:hypothetical protein
MKEYVIRFETNLNASMVVKITTTSCNKAKRQVILFWINRLKKSRIKMKPDSCIKS